MIKIGKCADTITTWEELRDAVHAGSSPLKVGDEIVIELKTGERVTLVCELVKDGHATFFTRDLLEDTHSMDEGWITRYKTHLSTMGGYLKKLFWLLPDDLQKVASPLRLLREREVFGENKYGNPEECEKLPRYRKLKNRVKRLNGVPFSYWLASPYAADATYFCIVDSDGSSNGYGASASFGVCFGFDI